MPARPTLHELTDTSEFTRRHVAIAPTDRDIMLGELGLGSIDQLIDEVVPASIRRAGLLELGASRTEVDVLQELRAIARLNRPMTSLIGQGYYGTITPPVILRNVLENPAWYTAYTPYQPEISQGRLEAILNFQTMVADLTAMDISNASMLDEATAAAEAMTMCRRQSKVASTVFFVDSDTHPQTIDVVRTRAEPLGIDIHVGDLDELTTTVAFGALLSSPGSSGNLRDLSATIEAAHASGCIVSVATDLLACVLMRSPGEMGADIVVGSAQRFGVPMGFGGPHAGFLACSQAAARSLPGRLVGVSTDAHGRPALRLALQTREQHIRREKATSNICTAQVLLANIAGLYAAWHGPDGLTRIATRVHRLASILATSLSATGYRLANNTWFDTVTIVDLEHRALISEAAVERGFNLRHNGATSLSISLDETSSLATVESICAAFGAPVAASIDDVGDVPDGIPSGLWRTREVLTHSVFQRHHSEHEMLRYLRRLADKDLALDRTMIPLGSCTMKLNATSEMIPITWPEFADVHPFAPADQTLGYAELMRSLEAMLVEITGYDAVSLQPNAGSQGEYAGLLAIRAYHRSRGDEQRVVCLIPSSAHGTNAASAVMAGMTVRVVACDAHGNVDLDDLRAQATSAGDQLAALMVTYPSTHGVFEEAITEICELIHDNGGQVYVDGANLNALVGVAQPGAFGADVSHLNLHKTFCIPHGGGGPGVGPIGVRAHLVPFLPGSASVPAISAAASGSAMILPISWVYITLMGAQGLLSATQVAILSANYIAHRLDPHFPVLYTGRKGWVAHECIIDLRDITKATGITVDDVAKRLMDYGFHAPTMSFPVPGTLMIEPTESESLAEINRFCDAMIAIRAEIARVESGEWSATDSPLRHAPHTAEEIGADAWDRVYGREMAAFPVPGLRATKYFPPVSRIDGAYGDRNLVCSCEPLEAYASAGSRAE